MNPAIPRMRMFAGPNGSGKSTIKGVIGPELLGVYINPDEIEKEIRRFDFLDFSAYGVTTTAKEVLPFFQQSPFLAGAGLADEACELSFNDGKLIFFSVVVNSYFASVAADFIRQKLLAAGVTFTFETVMSHPDKIELLRHAQASGFRTYLYYVATEDPEINISRVENRVRSGGHSVPSDKIVERYHRSLGLLADAVQYTDRAYFFDNSSHEKVWVAEITGGDDLEMKTAAMPHWFKLALWDKFVSPEERA
ncbi:MAG: zeta toxin family protein [Desulfobulbus sp.]|nr:zeta toxin family protein [Desulfobulbus sp.]